ncbi:cysteine proteinase inhibitor 2 [Beta vulgaris subsp. vulgaris]|uniref:cysteine proteinase inhibitor 2 n=1 Tax=Beta vulgaris subsp. vulgaris TaxID=3555 RepID=UPI0020373349|nr:cysteine proteinase inhibitor 2 [Beta vulgaris subsp. vulgaris]
MQKLTLFSLILLLFFFTTKVHAVQRGRMVGTKKEITDVNTNKEVQELGKFSVEEYNREILNMQQSPLRSVGLGDTNGPLNFVKVVEAQKQVVAGLKYYLKVEAMQDGVSRIFDAVVVVKPWVHESKKLLNFGPSSRLSLPEAPSEQM